MAPIRRYLRIGKHSVLECRIYLENPADSRWLLDSHDPALPRVFKSIRPHVLPKLREENERARAKKKSKPVKDVLTEDEFEVSIFLRESGTRHSLLTREKTFKNDNKKITSNSNKLTGGDSEFPIQISDDKTGEGSEQPIPAVEEDEQETPVYLQDIPENTSRDSDDEAPSASAIGRGSRKRRRARSTAAAAATGEGPDDGSRTRGEARDEKKLGMITTYDGFTIFGWVLCLIITRKGERAKIPRISAEQGNQALMEEWICTQAPQEYEED